MKPFFGQCLLALSVACAGVASAAGPAKRDADSNKIHHRINDDSPELNPDRTVGDALTAGSTGTLSAITNHGGPVMSGAPDVHLIWYGNWNQANGSDNAAGQAIVRDFMSHVGGSDWIKINTRGGGYTGTGSTAVSGNLGRVVEGPGNTGTSYSKRLSDKAIATIVSNYVATQGGASTNAIYFVLTSSDVNATSGFCTQYCGWHTKGTVGGVANVKYSFVGNANRCLSGCAAQTVGPNGNAGVDGMISVVAHELVETLSDPLLNAWYDSSGAENADKCAWTFGGAQTLGANGAYYNTTIGTRNFLIQRNLAIDSKCYIDGVSGQQ